MLASSLGRGSLGRRALGGLWGLVLSSTAIAGLGGPVAEAPGTARASSSATSPLAGATLQTQRLASGITLRQYVNPAGLVFAVGWEGPVLPDFQALLGDYYARYSEAQRQQSRQVHIRSNDLVLEAGGMMRAFSGRAYVPGLLPPTLSGADIR